MTRRRLYMAGGVIAAVVLAFLTGRFAAPTKTVERSVLDERIVAQAVAHAKAEWQRNVKDKTVTRTIYKGGKPVERVVYVDRETSASGSSAATSSSSSQTTTHASAEKVTTRARPGWSLGVAGTWATPSSMPDRLGLELDRRILGTVWLGVRASSAPDLAEPQLGLGVRVEF